MFSYKKIGYECSWVVLKDDQIVIRFIVVLKDSARYSSVGSDDYRPHHMDPD